MFTIPPNSVNSMPLGKPNPAMLTKSPNNNLHQPGAESRGTPPLMSAHKSGIVHSIMTNNRKEPVKMGIIGGGVYGNHQHQPRDSRFSERVQKAESKLKENAFDMDAWTLLIKEYQTKRGEDAKNFYERLVTRFPLTGRYWKLYIEHEMKNRQYDNVEKILARCLKKVVNIDLWRCYLGYVKETKANKPNFGESMARAYDFALDHIGIDIHSYPIWNDYVTFLKNVDAQGSYAENQKITAVRRVYQRGVVNPMINIENYWKDYIAYEQGINMIIAEKMIADRSRDYMNARRVAKEYEAMTKGLNRNAPSLPPSIRPDHLKQVQLWRKYIQWEKSNPLRSEDQTIVVKRVEFAHEQCLLCLGHHPDIWYEYAAYLEENAKLASDRGDLNQSKSLQDEVSNVYDRAINSLLASNILIHFAYADFEEGRQRKEKSTEIYTKLTEKKDDSFDPTLVYIQYMKFARRSEGIKSARAIFKKAREDPRSGHEVYTCAALMEYYCSKDRAVACKIFELGLKKYGHDPEFILAYIDFLSHLNEENNTRVLFERVLTSGALPAASSAEIWNKFLEFESNIGDLSSIIKVEKRRAAALEKLSKDTMSTAWLIDRYKFGDLLPCNAQELRTMGYVVRNTQFASTSSSSATCSGVLQGPFSGVSVGQQLTVDHSQPATLVPDLRQMIPYKPKINPIPGSHPLPGGIFPPPPSIGALLATLPHPSSFRGPFVGVEELINLFLNSKQIPSSKDYPSAEPPRPCGLQGTAAGSMVFETALATAGGPLESQTEKSVGAGKRPVEEDEEMTDGQIASGQQPSFDIYRSRQLQKRVK